eukprot:734159-Amorphochlora_amoeboformis.AAC.1
MAMRVKPTTTCTRQYNTNPKCKHCDQYAYCAVDLIESTSMALLAYWLGAREGPLTSRTIA